MNLSFTQKDRHCTLVGIYHEENMIGCCMIEQLDVKNCQLRQMVIVQEFRSMGIGKQLLTYAEKYCVETLNVEYLLFDARKKAVEFYLRNDYTIQSKEYLKVGIPHFKMSKRLKLKTEGKSKLHK